VAGSGIDLALGAGTSVAGFPRPGAQQVKSPNVPSVCAPRVRILSHALFLACCTLSLQALAADECGAEKTGELVCKPGTYPQVRY